MGELRIYGVHFLEALVLYLVQIAPARLVLSLGPREIVIKQLVEILQPDLPVGMVHPGQLQALGFDPQAGYVLSAEPKQFRSLLSTVQGQQPLLLVLFCDEPAGLASEFIRAGLDVQEIYEYAQLQDRIIALPSIAPRIVLIDLAVLSSDGDLVIERFRAGAMADDDSGAREVE